MRLMPSMICDCCEYAANCHGMRGEKMVSTGDLKTMNTEVLDSALVEILSSDQRTLKF